MKKNDNNCDKGRTGVFFFDAFFQKRIRTLMSLSSHKLDIFRHYGELNCFFVVWLTDERCLALFRAGTIFRDPHHRESPTRREQGLSLHRT